MIREILTSNHLEEVEDGIFSCLDQTERQSSYDNKVDFYDAVIGNRFYHRAIWGNWPSNYRAFCKQALLSVPDGIYLDAGCGSLVFTAEAYSEAENKQIVLLDRSIGMLIKGRDRIRKLKGRVPDNIIFIQGEIFNLPFKHQAFDTVTSFGVIHIFDDKLSLLTELERVKQKHGLTYFSSLVGNSFIGRRYLEILKKAGEVATCHSSSSLTSLLSTMPYHYKIHSIGNMAYVMSKPESLNLKRTD